MTTLENPGITQASASQEYHWTTERFYRAADAGVFDDPGRLELIHGRIIDRMPQGHLHLFCRVRLARRLRHVLEPVDSVIEECSIQIATDSVPVADVAVLRGGDSYYDTRLPNSNDIVLLIEVAVTTQEHDLSGKALLYAQAGIADYWVVLPEVGEVVVHRGPTPEGYRDVTRVAEDGTLSPLAAPEARLTVRELSGRDLGASSGPDPA